jgi:transcriptional regulator with XRE-family HTH domain
MKLSQIKKLRELSNLSIEYVSIQMEISINEYKKIERSNIIDLKLSKLVKLLKIFKINKSDFFTKYY